MYKRIVLCVSLLGMLLLMIGGGALGNRRPYVEALTDSAEGFVFRVNGTGGKLEETIHCFYREEDGIHYLFLPSYTTMGNVAVDSDGADYIRFAGGGNTVEIKNGGKLTALMEGTVYGCTFFRDGTAYGERKLCVLQSRNLPTLFIGTESGSMEQIDADKSYKEKGSFVLVEQDGTVACIEDLKHITGRGNETWLKPKKSYGIRLGSPADLLGMGAAKNWVLLCNVTDGIYIRNKITYDMAAAAGMEGAPESRFVDLYLNGKYHGLYQLSEKVEIDPQRIPIRNLENDNARVCDNYRLAESFGDDSFKGVSLDREPTDISGGYLIERDVYDKYAGETSGFQSPVSLEYYTVKSPERASAGEVAYIRDLFSEMEAAVRAPDGVNPDTGKRYTEYIDLRSFAQKYIIEELSKNNGGGASSSFFYKPADSVSRKIFAGPVWDYDKAYAKRGSYNANPRDLEYMTQRLEGTTLFRELSRHEEFREMVTECYRDFFSGYLEEVYGSRIDEYYGQIEPSVRMDRIRWGAHYGDYDWEEENRARVNALKEFVRARKEFLDEVWIEKKEICVVTFREETNRIDTSMGVIRGEKVVPVRSDDIWSMPEGMELAGWYDEETGEAFDEESPIVRDMVLIGKLEKK